jgi:hypothetical protein
MNFFGISLNDDSTPFATAMYLLLFLLSRYDDICSAPATGTSLVMTSSRRPPEGTGARHPRLWI